MLKYSTRDRRVQSTRNATYILSLVFLLRVLARADMKTKICSRCRDEKNVSQFNRKSASSDGFRSECRKCSIKATVDTRSRLAGVSVPYNYGAYNKPTILTEDEKFCSRCEEILPIEAFAFDSRLRSGVQAYCKACNAKRSKEYHVKLKAKLSKPAFRHRSMMLSMKSMYGLSEEDFQNLMNEQKGCCAVCGQDFGVLSTRAHIDHDHETGEVRGLLCPKCNGFIGHLELKHQLLQQVFEYLGKDKRLLIKV